MPFNPDKFVDPENPNAPRKFKAENYYDPDEKKAAPKMDMMGMAKSMAENSQVNVFPDIVRGGAEGVQRLGEGIKQAGLGAGESVGLVDEGSQAAYTQEIDARRAAQDQAMGAMPDSVHKRGQQVGQVLGEYGPYVAVPGGAASNIGARIATGGLAGGGIGFSTYVPEGGSRLQNTLLGTMIGSTLPATLAGFGAIKKSLIPSKADIGKDIAKNLQKEGLLEQTTKTLQSAKTFMTPGEASGSARVLAQEARLPLGGTRQAKLATKLGQRDEAYLQKVDDIAKDISPPGASTAASKMYEEVRQAAVPPELATKISRDPLLAKQIKGAMASEDYNLAARDPTKLEFFDDLKKFMKDKINSGNKSHDLKAAYKSLVSDLDTAVPEYAAAREASGKVIIARNMSEKIASIRLTKGSQEPTLSQIRSKLWGSDTDRAKFLKDMDQAGANMGAVRSIMSDIDNLSGSTTTSLITKTPSSVVSDLSLGMTGALKTLNRWRSGIYNGKMLKVMTDPELGAILASTPKKYQFAELNNLVNAAIVREYEESGTSSTIDKMVDQDLRTAGVDPKNIKASIDKENRATLPRKYVDPDAGTTVDQMPEVKVPEDSPVHGKTPGEVLTNDDYMEAALQEGIKRGTIHPVEAALYREQMKLIKAQTDISKQQMQDIINRRAKIYQEMKYGDKKELTGFGKFLQRLIAALLYAFGDASMLKRLKADKDKAAKEHLRREKEFNDLTYKLQNMQKSDLGDQLQQSRFTLSLVGKALKKPKEEEEDDGTEDE